MFNRNQLVHLVIWPNAKDARYNVVDPDGVVVSVVKVNEAVKGAEISKVMPEHFQLVPHGCTVLSMSGDLVVKTKAPFDTAIVTERAVVTAEERLQRLERRERQREKIATLWQQERAELMARLKDAEAVVEEPAPEPAPEPEPEPVEEAATE